MKKKIICLIVLFIGIVSVMPAQTDQFFFEMNGGVWFYPGVGGKVGWMHFCFSDKIGLIADLSYRVLFHTPPGGEMWNSHDLGFAAGIVFNNMGMNGTIRTSQHIKIKSVYSVSVQEGRDYPEHSFAPCLDAGFRLSVFFNETTAVFAGVGIESPIIYPVLSLGMTFSRSGK